MNIYIGNLDFKVEEPEIIKMFALFGDVETVKLIRDRDTGRSKGFAFIEMPKEEDARRAIDNLNESEVNGRKIKVNSADENPPKDDRRDDRRGGNHGGGQKRPPFNRDQPPRPYDRNAPRTGGYDRSRPPSDRSDQRPRRYDDRPPRTDRPASHDRPRTDRPGGYDRPRTDRPGGYDRPRTDRPGGYDRPRTDRGGSYDRPRTTRPGDEKKRWEED